ncbi:protein adenylyltransferase SelO family protein [Peristeroidobacter agariperforans]|uniref:protein adenylyltransferase SelO family protein n=1 Tax=Peristeroidobacter agariperforans TaxID=268404 RepID=UPI00101CF9E7|nr:YdiU family protein [Peristeroidobacter agariperforans]
MKLGFEHTYATLPARFYARVEPAKVTDAQVVIFNRALAAELRLDPDMDVRQAAALFSGNELAEDSTPIAMAYAGHQFGSFVPQLGDGRAILLGEIRDRQGVLRDVQLKGSGRTPFSRGGDGRAAIGPMLREYLISEAMHALAIPTTRSLAVVTTGEQVYRTEILPGAILTRVAASHIRVGTFQYFAARGDQEAVKELLDYVIARHYPETRNAEAPALAVLKAITAQQAALIADWMRVGFIHGVMNTDNMALSGETIDYGPCAFMDRYDPNTVFSSIDLGGRYSYTNQAGIAQWNLARLAETLLPLIDADEKKSIELATEAIENFVPQFETAFLAHMRRKIGLASSEDGDADLISLLLAAMQNAQADFTLTFSALSRVADNPADDATVHELFDTPADIDGWLKAWRARLVLDPQTPAQRAETMRFANPEFIPRNHRVEAALQAATAGDLQPFNKLLGILQRPYERQPDAAEYTQPPPSSDPKYKTFCGT